MPTIIRWPGTTQAGSVCDVPIMTIDYYATLLEVAAVKGDEIHNRSVDGVSLVPLLGNPKSLIERDLFWHYPHYHAGGDGPYSAIRSREWRLIEFHESGKLELYNLAEDVGEQNNLAARKADVARALLARLHKWRNDVDAQMPTENPHYDETRAAQVGRKRK